MNYGEVADLLDATTRRLFTSPIAVSWGEVWPVLIPSAVALVSVLVAALLAHFYRLRQWRYERIHDACADFLAADNEVRGYAGSAIDSLSHAKSLDAKESLRWLERAAESTTSANETCKLMRRKASALLLVAPTELFDHAVAYGAESWDFLGHLTDLIESLSGMTGEEMIKAIDGLEPMHKALLWPQADFMLHARRVTKVDVRWWWPF